jgi:hypothetical protein
MAEALAPFADERSREHLARLRSTRRSSMMPQGQQQVTPLDANARVAQSEATARTFASTSMPPGPIVPTAGGVARETSGPAKRGGRTGLMLGVAAGVVALAVAGALAMRPHDGPSSSPPIISEPPAAARPAPAPIVAQPPPIESAVLAPTAAPSEAPKASASAHAATVPATPPKPAPHAPGPGAPLPTQLGDLKLH